MCGNQGGWLHFKYQSETRMALDRSARKGVKVPKAAEIIARKIKRRIVTRDLQEGDFLPPEVKLMEEFGVSRPTIREAFRILETQNLVSVSRGARGGAVIHRPDTSLITSNMILSLAWEKCTVADVYETRFTVEPAVVRRVAEVAPGKVSERLQPALGKAYECIDDVEQMSVCLTRFLDELLDLADNHLLTYMYLTVREVLSLHQSISMNEGLRNKGEAMARVETHAFLNSYQKLVKLMSEEKADEAEVHWRKHIDYVYRTWVKNSNRYVSELFPEYD